MPFGFEEQQAKYNRDKQINSPTDIQYIEVTYLNTKEGSKIPQSFMWKDREIKIDMITDMVKGTTLKVSQSGMRYKCKAMGRDFYLNFDGRGWYIGK